MTAQIPDRIVIDGEVWLLLSTPLEPLLISMGSRIPAFVGPHTANWRGYIADWQIADGWLFLEAVAATVEGPDGLQDVKNGAALDGLHLPVLADWVTGRLRVGRGAVVRHVHADFESRWEDELLIDVTSGRVTQRRALAQGGAMGSAGPYQIREPLLGGSLSGGAFGQVMLAEDLDGRSLVAKAARPKGGAGGTEMWTETPEGRRPVHVPANAVWDHSGGGWSVTHVDREALETVLRNEAALLERDGGRLLPLSYGVWAHDPSGVPVLVMEKLEGRRPSSPDDVVAILGSLDRAVRRGTFDAHGDVKLEHVFIGDAGVRLCDPAPRFDDRHRRGFTPLYNPLGWSGAAADVAACATILRYMPAVGHAGWRWCASVLDGTVAPEWAHQHGRALDELMSDLSRAEPPPPGWVTPPFPESRREQPGGPTPRDVPHGRRPVLEGDRILPPVVDSVVPPSHFVVEAVRRATREIDDVRSFLRSEAAGSTGLTTDPDVIETIDLLRNALDDVRSALDDARPSSGADRSPLLDGDSTTVERIEPPDR